MIQSKKLLGLSFLISIIIYASISRASDQILATITTDVDSQTYQFIASVDDQDNLLKNFSIYNMLPGNMSQQKVLTFKTFVDEGLQFGPKGHYVLAKINVLNFDDQQGGQISIDTLYNGLTGKRIKYDLFLAKDKSGWKLYYEGRPITQIKAIAHRLSLIGIVGAKQLIMK